MFVGCSQRAKYAKTVLTEVVPQLGREAGLMDVRRSSLRLASDMDNDVGMAGDPEVDVLKEAAAAYKRWISELPTESPWRFAFQRALNAVQRALRLRER